MYIRKFEIDNFRSLKEVEIPQLNQITIFHGDNDVGKSNILAALELILRAKEHDISVIAKQEKMLEKRTLGFWKGNLDNFADNFYRDTWDPITFTMVVRFEPKELRHLLGQLERDKDYASLLRKGGNPDDLGIRGRIVRRRQDAATQELVDVKLNSKSLYKLAPAGTEVYCEALGNISDSKKYNVFENIMKLLNDSFIVIPSRRYIGIEKDIHGEECSLDTSSFKNWLHNLAMKRETHYIFEQIKETFRKPPFSFGEISFAREHGNLEIMIERGGLRLPIGRFGTGVQQILFLIASVTHNGGKMVGIEEMEINLSERSQNYFLQTLQKLISSENSAIRQILLSTHSYEYGRSGQVLRWYVDHDKAKTIIKTWNNTAEAELLKMRVARLMGSYPKDELLQMLLQEFSKDEIKKLLDKR
jgi:hypothetical protein